jgi:2,4-dienoyl-CoA reductase-like NADH-dependent reductase (Old Yellow Enzyme family)
MDSILLTPLKMGELTIKNRIIMAPLTRSRAGAERIPNSMMATYYAQRASAGMILTEATSITPQGVGYKATPGIWNEAQVEGWKLVTNEVHRVGGVIFLQLWHVGRISHPHFLDGELPVAPSAVRPEGFVSHLVPKRPFETPRALAIEEIRQIVVDYKNGAIKAKQAGFDGVELHGANGYLVEQFLRTATNLREDEYGGSIENRARFLLEVVDGLIEVWGFGRVGVHLSPEDDKEIYSYIARQLKARKIAFIFTREPQGERALTPMIKKEFGGVVIANQELDVSTAEAIVESNRADAVSWGKYYISNPDLVERIEQKIPFASYDTSTFYTAEAQGYIDYPRAT